MLKQTNRDIIFKKYWKTCKICLKTLLLWFLQTKLHTFLVFYCEIHPDMEVVKDQGHCDVKWNLHGVKSYSENALKGRGCLQMMSSFSGGVWTPLPPLPCKITFWLSPRPPSSWKITFHLTPAPTTVGQF